MHRTSRGSLAVCATAACSLLLITAPLTVPAQAAPGPVVDPSIARSPELSETSRLSDRRFVVTGDRAWALGAADGSYPAAGFHTRGEMGGYWLPNLKLLDGMWFNINGDWIGKATKTTSGWGYVRADLPTTHGVSASRTDFVPRGVSGALVGLTLRSERSRTITLRADAHSELLSSYPWGETKPSQTLVNLADSVSVRGKHLLFRDRGTPKSPNFESHDWAAAFGSDLSPFATKTGKDFRGPQDPAVICPASGPSAPPQPERCDDTKYGKGAGGQLGYKIKLRAGKVKTVWFGVGGSTSGPTQARAELRKALGNPEAAIRAVVGYRQRVDTLSEVSLPGNPLLTQSVAWSKQMLAASEQRVNDLQLRAVNAGQAYPPPAGTLKSMRWLGAGWPDYTWLFATDGEYTAFAAVAAGQFGPIKDHLRALRDVSEIVNEGSGKIVHEVTPDGAVYFGASVKAMKYVSTLDEDGDGWPEGLGNVERASMGEEKLDNAVYTIRGYADLADLANAVGDGQTKRWATKKAKALLDKFEDDWWYPTDGARSYADSLDDPGNNEVFQRHWIGLTPTDAVLPNLPGRRSAPLASDEHGNTTLTQHERLCFTDKLGLFHTGTGPTSAPGGNPGPSCDSVVSEVPSERNIFTLNSAIAGVSEGNFGRLGADQQGVYVTGNSRSQLDPSLWEMPGAMPEIVPGGDFGANIDRLFTERSMVMQAWGAYGVLWPVIHQWLGVSPELGRGRVAVVPQLPAGQTKASADKIKLGLFAIDVAAAHQGSPYTTTVTRHGRMDLRIGAVLPDGATVAAATLNGSP